MLRRSVLWVAVVVVGLCTAAGRAGWVAYNDCLRQNGDTTAANVTGWTIHNRDQTQFTGRLLDFATGSDAGMPVVTFTMGGASLQVSSGRSGGNFAPGTDGYDIFHGIVDFGPDEIYYGGPGWWVEMEFTGLDPKSRYTFIGSTVRSRSYPERVTLFTLLDAVSFVNNSSAGVVAKDGPVTKLLAGDNSITGYVVRWDEIVPSADGTFKVRAEAAPESGGLAYPFGGFMLAETGRAGNRPPQADAGEYEALVWPAHTLELQPAVSDDDPCQLGRLTFKWSQLRGPGRVTFEPADNIENPTAVFLAPGEYELQLQVWDELLQEAMAQVTITIAEPLYGDFNGDNKVNWWDLLLFTKQWLDPAGSPADLNITHGVDLRDYAIVARNWRIGEGPTLVINEFLARNDLTNQDPQGEYDDWIELYNGGEQPVDVGGMYLTDDRAQPAKWRIPRGKSTITTIAPGAYLLVWADSEPGTTGLHAAFALDEQGGEIALFDTDGVTLMDHVPFGSQTPDVSFGREPDGAPNWVTLAPTPGLPNRGAFLAVVADTKFSHDRGFYAAPFEVTITTATEGAAIVYTTDGSTPAPLHGTTYAGPIRIATTTLLRAMAFKPGWKATNVDTHSYIFLEDVIRQATDPATGAQVTPAGYPTSWGSVTGDYQMDPEVIGPNGKDIFGGLYANSMRDDLQAVPTLSLVMDKDDWFGNKGIYINKSQDGTERVASFEFIDPRSGQSVQANCALAMQGGVTGGGTSLQRWKSFKLSLRPRFKTRLDNGTPTGGPPKLDFAIFRDSPVERLNTIVLDAVLNHSWLHPGSDQRNSALYVQDQYVADLHNAMGGHSGHGSYAHVYINGLYWGLYYLHERPDHAWAAEVFGGDEDEYDALKHNSGGVIDNGAGGSATANLNAMLAQVDAVRSDPASLTKYRAVCNALDVNDFATYLLANWFTGNHDWPAKNWYATHRNAPDGQWRFHSWDAEHTLEGGNSVGQSPLDIHGRLAASAEYRLQFADMIHRNLFNGGPLTHPAGADLFRRRVSEIDRAIVGESARWGDNRQNRPYTRQDWLNTADNKLSTFFPGRTGQLLNWLKAADLYPALDAPEFQVNGQARPGGHMTAADTLSLSPALGVAYYTLDGADPRLPGGAVNTARAKPYTGPMKLTRSAHVKGRALSGTTWSALSEAVFAVGPVAESLRLSEIMYHPADPNTEFIELTNIGTATINLNMVRFTDGIDFAFGAYDLVPGGYCLVVEDAAAFERRYEPGLPVAGRYAGSLNNAGERIELQDAVGTVIHSFRFEDNWSRQTDGHGYSLTLKDPATADPNALGDKNLWRASTRPGGSPGTPDR